MVVVVEVVYEVGEAPGRAECRGLSTRGPDLGKRTAHSPVTHRRRSLVGLHPTARLVTARGRGEGLAVPLAAVTFPMSHSLVSAAANTPPHQPARVCVRERKTQLAVNPHFTTSL